ncbi:hypothetical protein Esi_0022_0080 [Ectocarpus siliculosus]|uniref:Uncharacterized protein n=1 Tax=Ectocarpus siliculosus TaxID=2880 RepID=D8LIF3_ECTSI|nr:hypothetical protein Esi_0022_0080 [Ectocarpus siliculosus]|eukprot:CBN79992.1 hypothetical protein Esi_0022_0080 [Ectocarpus siliculosus]
MLASKVKRGGDHNTRGRCLNIVSALRRRRALGKKGCLPFSHGLPKAPARLVYAMSNAIPVGERHDRVILGFTADGEHLVVCRGPLAHPRRLELRRVRLQRPGLSAPGEALWSLPLSLRARGDPYAENGYASSAEGGEGGYSSGEDMEEEDGEEEMLHGSGMDGIGDEEPASVAVTESSDGFLVVAVVSRVEMQEDEDRVYHVFVAPGPSYLAAVNASAETPFVGAAFSYIVPGSGGAPVPSIAAHDVGCVDGAAGAGEERVYMIVLNAVDAIRVVEVRLHTEGAGQASPPPPPPSISPGGGRCPARVPVGGRRSPPLPFDTTFTIRPPELLQASSKSRGDGAGGRAGGGGGDAGGSASVDGGSSSSSADPMSLWWSCGRDLPSMPLVGTHRVFPFRRRGPATSVPAAAAEPALAATARGAGQLRSRRMGGETAEPAAETPSGGSSISRPTEGDAEGEELTRRSGGRTNTREAKTVAAAAVESGGVGGESAHAGGGSGGEASRAEGADSNGGVGEGDADGFSARAPSVHATDYHCVTAGLRDGGRGVLLSLVVKVMYTGSRRKRKRGGGGGDGREEGGGGAKTGGGSATGTRNGSGGDASAAVEGPFLLSYILDLDLELSNTAVFQGRSVGAITNPVYPVAIVMEDDDY